MRHYIIPLLVLIFTLGLKSQAEVQVAWSTPVAIPGEQVMLYISIVPDSNKAGSERFSISLPRTSGANVREAIPQTIEQKTANGTQIVRVQPVYVVPDSAGTFQMDNVEVYFHSTGKRESVAIPPLRVRPTDDIRWYNSPYEYGVLWYIEKREAYAHQALKVAFKLFLPQNSSRYAVRWYAQYAPTFNSEKVNAGTFRSALSGVLAHVHNSYVNVAKVRTKGKDWQTMDFSGTFTPTEAGNHTVTGKIGMVMVQGYSSTEQSELVLPPVSISALPLPPSAPADFADAVGEFQITATTKAKGLAMHEAEAVEITITGTGDLEHIECPQPESPGNWKLQQATRRDVTDLNDNPVAVVFTQMMRPTTEVGGIPAFRFSYFDPEKQEYRTAETKPIALPWHKTDSVGGGGGLQNGNTAEPPPAGTIPVAEMTDIYSAFIPLGTNILNSIPRWVCYLLYLPAIGILLAMAGMAIKRRMAAGAAGRAQEKALADLGHAKDGIAFLKGLGSFIESNIPNKDITPELQEILDKRDSQAFRPDAQDAQLGQAERNAMLRHVRRALARTGKAAVLLLAGVLLLGTDAGAEESEQEQAIRTAYESAQYSDCLSKLEPYTEGSDNPSAEAWYLAGNCHYRLEAPGKAALCYARALQVKPWFKEAKANLAFIQRKEGAILPKTSTTDEIFTFLSSGQLWLATVFSTAWLALCIANQIRRRHKNRPWLHVSTSLALLFSILCIVDRVYYSTREINDITDIPPTDLAYVLTTTEARTAAAADASAVIQLPASTPVHLLALRGSWSYVEAFDGTRGWVPSDTVERLKPSDEEPTAPVYIKFD